MKPGIYTNLSNEDYHGGEGVSKSGLDLIARSPAHYRARYIDGADTTPTPAMLFGTAFHTAILEPGRFAEEYLAAPKCNRGTKAWMAFEAKNPGKTIIKPGEFDSIRRMVESVQSHPVARGALLAGKPEQSVFWEDPDTGSLCRCRPDFWRDDGAIIDVKTAADGGPEEFMRSASTYRYHVQAAFYLDGCLATGNSSGEFFLVVVEKEAPFNVSFFLASNEMVAAGRDAYRENLDTYDKCIRTDDWPGYPAGPLTLNLPPWAV